MPETDSGTGGWSRWVGKLNNPVRGQRRKWTPGLKRTRSSPWWRVGIALPAAGGIFFSWASAGILWKVPLAPPRKRRCRIKKIKNLRGRPGHVHLLAAGAGSCSRSACLLSMECVLAIEGRAQRPRPRLYWLHRASSDASSGKPLHILAPASQPLSARAVVNSVHPGISLMSSGFPG